METEIIASVVIPVRGDKGLGRLLQSLQNQTMPREQFEVIVVENGSVVCGALASACGARYLRLDYPNTYAARNLGVRASVGKYVLATDSDCVAASDWIQAYIQCFDARPDISVFGGPIDRYSPKTAVQMYGSNLVNGQRSLNYLPILQLPYVVTANCAYRKEALLEVGGYDEAFLSGGDVDVCYKLALKRHQIAICPSALIFHDNRPTVKSHFKRFFRYASYQALLFRKYRAVAGRRFRLNPYPYQCIRAAAAGMARGALQPNRIRSELLWSSWLLLVEGLGVLTGDAFGACKFRVPYL